MLTKEILLYDLYIAYNEAKRHKTKSHSHIEFAYNLEENLIKLRDDIYEGKYEILPSIYFVQQYPVKREVFAGNFRDRIVHHLIYNYISPYREKQFIYDSYSCRRGKGTMFGINRTAKFMRACSDCYTKQGWILKLDIQGYFMAINRDILRKNVSTPLLNWGNINSIGKSEFFSKGNFLIQGDFPEFLLRIIHDIIYNNPTSNGIFKGKKTDYNGLPKSKSLFFSEPNCGLPIGNLTSQLFSNIYLNSFDHYVKENLGIKYYGRYVDDFVLIHPNKEYLKSLIKPIEKFLSYTLHLKLHPNKIYLQPISNGLQFLGAIIKPYRIYRGKRTISNFYNAMKDSKYRPQRECLDSYLGLLYHYKHHKIVQKILKNVDIKHLDYIPNFALSFLE